MWYRTVTQINRKGQCMHGPDEDGGHFRPNIISHSPDTPGICHISGTTHRVYAWDVDPAPLDDISASSSPLLTAYMHGM